jgi:hypothetical protein
VRRSGIGKKLRDDLKKEMEMGNVKNRDLSPSPPIFLLKINMNPSPIFPPADPIMSSYFTHMMLKRTVMILKGLLRILNQM